MIALIPLVVSSLTLMSPQTYEYPARQLDRNNGIGQVYRLIWTDTLRVSYTWHEASKAVVLNVRRRESPIVEWRPLQERRESTSYTPTTVCSKYGVMPGIYIVGVKDDGTSIVEKWTIIWGLSGNPSFARQLVVESSTLTHINACAAPPNASFLLAHHMETGNVLRVDLVTHAIETVMSADTYPTLIEYDQLLWREHSAQGHAFQFCKGRRDPPQGELSVILMWDAEPDGRPNTVTYFGAEDWQNSPYSDIKVWKPDNELWADVLADW